MPSIDRSGAFRWPNGWDALSQAKTEPNGDVREGQLWEENRRAMEDAITTLRKSSGVSYNGYDVSHDLDGSGSTGPQSRSYPDDIGIGLGLYMFQVNGAVGASLCTITFGGLPPIIMNLDPTSGDGFFTQTYPTQPIPPGSGSFLYEATCTGATGGTFLMTFLYPVG